MARPIPDAIGERRASGGFSPEQRSVSSAPLDGLVVLDLSRVLSGPYAAMMLGDLGARVVKVEHPEHGDDTRLWGPPFMGDGSHRQSTYFLSVNRNKESITLNLKDPADRLRLLSLVDSADILIENFRNGVLDRLGLSHESLLERNERLIVLSITGFGHTGPDADRPGYDQIVQGESGLMSLTGHPTGEPLRMGIPIADILSGIFGMAGVLAALHRRAEQGVGDIVRTSLFASSLAVQTFQAARWLLAGDTPTRTGNQHPTVVPYGAFSCQGEHLQIAVGNQRLWRRFSSIIGIDPDDPRYATNEKRVANRVELEHEISSLLTKRPVDDWVQVFAEEEIPAGKIRTLDEVYDLPQVYEEGLVIDVDDPVLGRLRFPGSPIQFDRAGTVSHLPPPLHGQHGGAIDAWLNRTSPNDASTPGTTT